MASFLRKQFLEDVEETCKAINAPYSASMTGAVISAYSRGFLEGAVLWRTTDRPNGTLNYRFYKRRPMNLLGIAMEAGLLQHDNPLAWLLAPWSLPWGEGRSMGPEESCDFDAEKGLAKAWAFMGGLRPLDDLLNVDNVSEFITQHRIAFEYLGLQVLRHVAVDFQSNTVNLHFRASGSMSTMYANELVELVGHFPLAESESSHLRKYLSPEGFTFAVTIDMNTGQIKRVAFYALGLSLDDLPYIGDRLKYFFLTAPSHDKEEFTAVAWSFRAGEERHVKAEKSYCGGAVPLLRNWKSTFTS